MWFRAFIYSGPATTADFIVDDSCNEVATATVVQRATYPKGTSEEIAQLEKNFYSYQVGYLKTLFTEWQDIILILNMGNSWNIV